MSKNIPEKQKNPTPPGRPAPDMPRDQGKEPPGGGVNKQQYESLILNSIFPSPLAVLKTHSPIKQVISRCVFVLDANCLLAPFTIGKDSLEDISQILTHLTADERLFVPSRAIREFAKHRAAKVKEVFEYLHKLESDIPRPPAPDIRMFQGIPQLDELVLVGDTLKNAIKDYKPGLFTNPGVLSATGLCSAA